MPRRRDRLPSSSFPQLYLPSPTSSPRTSFQRPHTPRSPQRLAHTHTHHMSEVASRPARGRSAARGGRGSYGSRGPRKTNGDASPSIDTSADQGELGELKKRYQSQLSTLKELFPDWTDAELVLALEESDGDLQTTIEKISEGKQSSSKPMHRTPWAAATLPPVVALSQYLTDHSL